MRQSYDVTFVSSNRHKYAEAREILAQHDISLGFYRRDLVEIQADSLEAISKAKSRDAFAHLRKPVIVEDAGLFIDSLGGFPGPYSSYVLDTISNAGILRLVGSARSARFISVVSYTDRKGTRSFSAVVRGAISKKARGSGWGYDPIFVPRGRRRTFAQIADKNSISHRYLALKKFARWFDTV